MTAVAARKCVASFDAAITAWSEAFGGEAAFDAMILEGDSLTVRQGDAVPYTPPDRRADLWAPWEVWYLMKAMRSKALEQLAAVEAKGLGE